MNIKLSELRHHYGDQPDVLARIENGTAQTAKAQRRKARYTPALPKPEPTVPADLAFLLTEAGLPQPLREFKFDPGRKWAFDYAWVVQRIALEVEGGIWSGGRHVRGAGYIRDMEKYSRASILGWKVIRVMPKTLCAGTTIDALKQAFLNSVMKK